MWLHEDNVDRKERHPAEEGEESDSWDSNEQIVSAIDHNCNETV